MREVIAKIEHLENSTKSDIANTRNETRNEISSLKWLILAIGGVITILLTIIALKN